MRSLDSTTLPLEPFFDYSNKINEAAGAVAQFRGRSPKARYVSYSRGRSFPPLSGWWLIGRAGDILACWLKFECSRRWSTNTDGVCLRPAARPPPLPSFYMLKSSRWVSDLHTMRSDCSRVDLFAHQHSRKTKGVSLCQKRRSLLALL